MNVVITRDVEADKQGDMTYVLEFTTEDGSTQSFETLHYETTPISLKSVDAAAGATPSHSLLLSSKNQLIMKKTAGSLNLPFSYSIKFSPSWGQSPRGPSRPRRR